MRVLRSKHQKLILQCYPPGKGADKNPNPLELSYLLYYASTRRVKLEKVIEFLKHKTKADVRGRKLGNLLVTLSIVLLLIDKCFENLNAFAPQVCEILLSVLTLKELPLSKAAAATYGVFCSRLDTGLFAGDKAFVALFSHVTLLLLELAEHQLALQSTDSREWKLVSLRTCRHVFSCVHYNSQLSSRFIPECVAILSPAVRKVFTLERLQARLKASLNVEQTNGTRPLVKVPTARSVSLVNHRTRDSFDEDSVSDLDLAEEALVALKALFHTSISLQISAATKLVVEHEFTRQQSTSLGPMWGPIFLQVCALFIPVQLRFETLLTLLDTLSQIASRATSAATNFLHMRHYASYIRSLVALGFNMIGLSISDILVQFLTLKTNLYLELSEVLDPKDLADLSEIYLECICNLSSHIYYFDQVSDAIEGILMQVDTVLLIPGAGSGSGDTARAQKVYLLVLDLLAMISTIMELLSANSSAISWNRASLENWDVSFQLLTFAKSYPTFALVAPRSHVLQIQATYLQIVQSFLDRELFSKATKPDQTEELDGADRYLEPNYKNYIEDPGNSLAVLLSHCGGYFDDADFFVPSAATALARIVAVIAGITGVNFAHNFFPFFRSWQLQSPSSSAASRIKDLFAYFILTTSVSALNEKYQDLLDNDLSWLSLSEAILHDVQHRQKELWDLASSPLQESSLFTNQVSVGLIEDFFAETALKQWVVSSSAVLVEFDNGEGHKLLSKDGTHTGDHFDPDNVSFSSGFPHPGGRFGLGTANDISSIYSGLQAGQTSNATKPSENFNPDTSLHTHATQSTHATQLTYKGFEHPHSYKRFLMPKVQDLKHSVDGSFAGVSKFASSNGADASSARSILQKQLHTTDVMSILDDLKIEDDKDIVV